MTPAELRGLMEKGSPGDWTAYRMVHADRGDDMTPEECGEYVKNSVLRGIEESGSRQFLAIGVQKPDGPADVCHVGNGPTSPHNAKLIAAAINALPALLECVEALRRIRQWDMLNQPNPKTLADAKWLAETIDAALSALEAVK